MVFSEFLLEIHMVNGVFSILVRNSPGRLGDHEKLNALECGFC